MRGSHHKFRYLAQLPDHCPLKPEEIPEDFLHNTDFLLLDGLMTEVSLYAAEKAREKHIPVMLDAGRVREGMRELASVSDYVVASDEFGRDLVKENNTPVDSAVYRPEDALLHMKSFGAKACTLTIGAKGSLTLTGGEIFHTPALTVDVIDTTGAGDVFHGGYIYGLLQKWGIREVVRFATAFASLKCRKLGGRAGIPGLEEVMAFLRKHDYTDKTT